MPEIDANLRKAIIAPLRVREQGLVYAQLFVELCDEVTEALCSRRWRPDLPADIATFKRILGKYLEKSGEARYQALVRELALELIEHHPGDTAEEAVAVVESAMLEAAVGSDR